MSSELSSDFAVAFKQLTGQAPFPWQVELYRRFTSDSHAERIPPVCRIPTGLGKTSLIAVWLIALRHGAPLPRRLVYVVNRRTVVDQTTEEVERLRRELGKLETSPGLAISTLRGQFADNREWLADPSRPAVICGTVDMIGSRLLFSGYRIGFKSRPLHAGFLGQDVLLVHDEAHLEPAFQTLVEDIERIQHDSSLDGCDVNPWPKIQTMALSATSRLRKWSDERAVLELTNEERTEPPATAEVGSPRWLVWKRLTAKKQLQLHAASNKQKRDRLVELGLAHAASSANVIVFVRGVDDASEVVTQLEKELKKQKRFSENVVPLTGTMRGYERDRLSTQQAFQRFLPQASSAAQELPAYLVCTSAGEVGVNISADHLVCDLSTWESMVQRFGRVNRFGECPGTQVDVVHPDDFSEEALNAEQLERTLRLLEKLQGDASPRNIETLDPAACEAAYSPAPDIPRITDILLDAWAMTSIRQPIPGRPPVESYLHGVTEWEPARASVAWRKEVSWLPRWRLDQEGKEAFALSLLEDYPLKPHELLNDTCERVHKHIQTLAKTMAEPMPVWIWNRDQQIDYRQSVQSLADLNKKQFARLLQDATLLLPPEAGGLNDQGMLDGKAAYDPSRDDYDVADQWQMSPQTLKEDFEEKPEPSRQRIQGDQKLEKGMVLVRSVRFEQEELPAGWNRKASSTETEDSPSEVPYDNETLTYWRWYVRAYKSEESPGSANALIPLEDHVADVKAIVSRFVASLKLPEELQQAVILAAELHDLGKRRDRWQRSIGNPEPWRHVAKSVDRKHDPSWTTGFRLLYRHEFGSLRDALAEKQKELDALGEEMRDVVLHLIAAHHGHARPHFTLDGMQDPELTDPNLAEQLGMEVTRRFVRLQRKYGRWGLAYLESLLRAADWQASAQEVNAAVEQEVAR